MRNKKWGSKSWKEYGNTKHIDYTHPDFLDYFKKLVRERTENLDGVMFDL